MSLFYDRQGKPLDIDEFERLYTGPGRKERITVGSDWVGPVLVSTVWLGANYNFSGVGPPILFETMTFDPAGSPWNCRLIDRYYTETEALEGHQRTCSELAQVDRGDQP